MEQVIEKLKGEIVGLKSDLRKVENKISLNVMQSALKLKEKQLESYIFQYEARKKVYLKVIYNGGMDYYDGLTTGREYGVHDEKDNQYVVINDAGSTSTILKSKFKVMNE